MHFKHYSFSMFFADRYAMFVNKYLIPYSAEASASIVLSLNFVCVKGTTLVIS